jgi:hypothetical protein
MPIGVERQCRLTWVLIYVHLAFRLQPENGSNIAELAATLLSPALPLTGPVARSDPITLTAPVAKSNPRSGRRGLGAAG